MFKKLHWVFHLCLTHFVFLRLLFLPFSLMKVTDWSTQRYSCCNQFLSSRVVFWQTEIFVIGNIWLFFFFRHHCLQWSLSYCPNFYVKIPPILLTMNYMSYFYKWRKKSPPKIVKLMFVSSKGWLFLFLRFSSLSVLQFIVSFILLIEQ